MMARWILAMAVVAVVAWPRWAGAAMPVYVVAIGNNAPPNGGPEKPLQYSDDDAVAFFEFTSGFSREARLLTVMDADTQARFPQAVSAARPPSLAELRAQMRQIRSQMENDRQRGEDSALVLFFSGHGSRPVGKAAGLALVDGELTRDILYNDVLTGIPARVVHLFVDACHAEAIVRPRDAEAQSVRLTASDLADYATTATLLRFPNVGAIVASSAAAQSHEWDIFRHGVFTHELISGLRGAADVNGDGRIEYSELYAFLSAANRDVPDARARISVVARPPADNVRVSIVDLAALHNAARLTGIPPRARRVFFEDQLGNRLADVHVETGTTAALMLPTDRQIFVRCALGEALFSARAQESMTFDQLHFRPPESRVRGSLSIAMEKGLFSIGFGPAYYRGFIDQSAGFVPVAIPTDGADAAEDPKARASDGPSAERVRSFWPQVATAGVGVARGVAEEAGPMPSLRVGLRPVEASGVMLTLDGCVGQGPGFTEWRTAATVGYRLGIAGTRLGAFVGASLGPALGGQSVESGRANNFSAGLIALPQLGARVRAWPQVSIGLEADGSVFLFRSREGGMAAAFVPSAHLSVAFEPWP